MQFLGHIKVDEQVILVLVRGHPKQGYNSLKMRKSGKPGRFLHDESIGLSLRRDKLKALVSGEVIHV